jgi:transcriptional regulator with XRE-family HTH domain
MTTFGRRMHQRREQLGLSQQEISRLTGIPQSRLSEFEGGGRREMTVSTALKIARVLGVGLDYLVGTFDEEAATPQDAAVPVEAAARGPRHRGRPRKAAPVGAST